MDYYTEVTLPSLGINTQIKRLGMFDLGKIQKPKLTKFTYRVQTVTETVDVPLTSDDFNEIPERPDIPEHEAKEGTNPWYDWRTYLRYQAMIKHEEEQEELVNQYLVNVAQYILENCVQEEIHSLIQPEDWEIIHSAALCPIVQFSDIVSALQEMDVSWGEQDIFDAMQETGGGAAAYNACKMWEVELMNYLGWSEYRYLKMPIEERARRIVALKYKSWFEVLQSEEMEKKYAASRTKAQAA